MSFQLLVSVSPVPLGDSVRGFQTRRYGSKRILALLPTLGWDSHHQGPWNQAIPSLRNCPVAIESRPHICPRIKLPGVSKKPAGLV